VRAACLSICYKQMNVLKLIGLKVFLIFF